MARAARLIALLVVAAGAVACGAKAPPRPPTESRVVVPQVPREAGGGGTDAVAPAAGAGGSGGAVPAESAGGTGGT